jgi:hypothetical protein
MTTAHDPRHFDFSEDASRRLMGFAIGATIGAILVWALFTAHTSGQFVELISVITALLAGAGVVAANNFKVNMSSAGYGAGLAIALLWGYSPEVVRNIAAASSNVALLGWGHLAALVLVTALVMFMFVVPEVAVVLQRLSDWNRHKR